MSDAGCGSVLYIGGAMPRVGVDLQLHEVLESMKLKVEDARETAEPSQAAGKQLVILSYSMSSNDFAAEAWASVPVPILVLEHFLLPRLGMTTAEGHGYQDGVTALTLSSDDAIFSAGMSPGDVTVYSQVGEFFWGIPGPGAVTVATVVGNAAHEVTFGYPAGSAMVDMPAPARRVQAFVAVHAPPPNPTPFLNTNGLQLFRGAVAWAIQ